MVEGRGSSRCLLNEILQLLELGRSLTKEDLALYRDLLLAISVVRSDAHLWSPGLALLLV